MAKSIFEIQMDRENAIRQADALEQTAKELTNAVNRDMQDCMGEISRNWTGSNASAYIRKCGMLKSNVLITAGKLNKTADTIRRIATNTYDAEMRALVLARHREY